MTALAGGKRRSPVPILIVDDNTGKRLALKAALAPLGHAIVESDSGTDALRCVMAQDFAVILLDVRMPLLDGFATAALIRQRRESEMTPIIFITSYASDEIAIRARYAGGAVDFMFAPVKPDEIRAKVSVFAKLFSQADELAAQARDVQRSADQLRLLTDAAPVGIFQTDTQNRFVYTNPRWSEITGVEAVAAAGRTWDDIFGTEQRADAEPAGGAPDPSERCDRFEIRPAGSAARIVLVTSKAIPGSDGGVAGWVGTLADVTAETGAETAMSNARDEANAASRLKSDFLANMSHEIRTPMNGVIGMTDLLLETDLDARQRDYAQTVRNSGEALMTIINDILDFSKVEAGKLVLENVPFSLRAIVGDVVDLLAGAAQAKGLELVAVVERSVPAVVSGDPGRVRQVLTNLIGNAIKFTQAGEIVVRAARGDEGSGPDAAIRFDVTDTGVGIAPGKTASIFEPFVQADSSTSRKYGGTGLGLAISGQLVALMGGDCGVTSRLGAGSSFWFTVRVRADQDQALPGPCAPDAGLAGVAALIVDDNITQLSILSEHLTGWGMDVTAVSGGEAALAALRAAAPEDRPFAVALVDRSMPGMDGVELKDAIFVDPDLSARVVLMTDLGQELDPGDAVDSGVGASLSKPIHPEELRTCLRMALGLQAADVAPRRVTARAPTRADEPELGRLLLAEDNVINQKVAVAMLSGAGYRVDTVLNGAAAVQAVAARHYDAVLMDCHMPELNGYEATAAIRAHEGSRRRTPIIAMTAGARREDRDRCLAEGMDSYLAKPVSKDALLTLVARSVRAGAATNATVPPEDDAPAGALVIDSSILVELRALGEASGDDLLALLVEQYVHDTEPLLGELRAALELGDGPAVRRIAHSIKGGSAQLGAQRLALACGRLEAEATAGDLSGGQDALQAVETDYRDLRRTLKQELSPPARQGSPVVS